MKVQAFCRKRWQKARTTLFATSVAVMPVPPLSTDCAGGSDRGPQPAPA